MNSAAQVVEIVHCMDDVIRLIDVLLKRGIEWEKPAPVTLAPGARGVGACDVPRGNAVPRIPDRRKRIG